jgi:hypothetical protein
MRSYPSDLAPVTIVFIGALVLVFAVGRLLQRYRSRTPCLRLLTGSRAQHAGLRLALVPVLREFLPLLDSTGREVRAIVVVPTLSGSAGEALAAELEQVGGSTAFVLRLAHRLGATVRQPEEVAGALAENLLYLYRQAAAVTVVRQTFAPAAAAPVAQAAPAHKPVGRNGLTAQTRRATQQEAERPSFSSRRVPSAVPTIRLPRA